MPDKPLTIATYAAGASLAAITLVYVFGPTFFLDEDTSGRKKGVVGLTNPANDCFINAVLQALAGLPDLRVYLIRETHRRNLDGADAYKIVGEEDADGKRSRASWKKEALQQGTVTHALKHVLDKLNERPLYKKTISAQNFITALEHAFHTRISRQQQDAQEFLQIVTERLCDEYHAGHKARKQAYKLKVELVDERLAEIAEVETAQPPQDSPMQEENSDANTKGEDKEADKAEEVEEDDLDEEGFPFEGKIESQIECLTCGFRPKPAVSTFVTLTLNVPQKPSTTLNSCFDGMMKIEHIDDFKCDNCRLEHALRWKHAEIERTTDTSKKHKLEADIGKIQKALKEDPEKPPKDADLPDIKTAPKRRITRHMRIAAFPKILAIHLSRSIYSAATYSTKNMSKVAFPESLPLGGLLDRKKYRLLGVVTHKGSHNSGHYESFRRQITQVPFSTPHSFGAEGVYSIPGTPRHSNIQSPRLSASTARDSKERLSSIDVSQLPSPSERSATPSSLSSRSSLSVNRRRPPTSAPRETPAIPAASPSPTLASSSAPTVTKPKSTKSKISPNEIANFKRATKKRDNRWWRISDEKIKESKTSEVLSMQKEVYLLFYELDRREEEAT